MDVDFVPPAPVAALYPPVEIINEDEQEDSAVAAKASKKESQADTPPPADETNRCQGNEKTLDSIIVKAPAPRTAVNDEATREVVGPSRRQSS